MVKTEYPLNGQVLSTLYEHKFALVDNDTRVNGQGLIRQVQLKIQVHNGRHLELVATLKELDHLTSFFGHVADAYDDNSTEFDYIDAMGRSFDGVLLQLIRAVGQH